ncbi:MAG: ATP-binding protein [Lachnospiraceae bacterium]|nr:ATP-binding protein [Lachnospiraceae bacterium]
MNFLEITIYRIILKSYLYLEETGRQNSFERFPYLRVLTERLTEAHLEAWQRDAGPEACRYYELLSRLCGEEEELDSGILYNVLDLCLAAAYVPEFAAYLNYYTGNIVTIQLASELDGITHSSYNDIMRRLQKLQKVCTVDWNKNPLPYASIEIDNALLSYLTGSNSLFPKLYSDRVEYFEHCLTLHPLFIRQNFAVEGAAWLSDTGHFHANILHLKGSGGKRFLARHTACLMKKDLLLVHMPKCKCLFESDAEADSFWNRLVHAAYLKNAVVCLHGITTPLLQQIQTTASDFLTHTVLPFVEADLPVILCTDAEVHVSPGDCFHVHQIALREPSRGEREAMFCGFSKLYQLPLDCADCSVRYQLSASEIADAVSRWRSTSQDSPGDFAVICKEILYEGQAELLGQLLYPSIQFEDLKLPLQTKKTLEQICCSASEGYRIFEEWNLKRQYPYGRAVTVLLYGPPGTGKTMTAHAMAKELGTALYQIDLSHVLDKYIGETEKHLEQIFAFAQKAKPVLFFDEADSLFGKRSEVTDGKDRYANMEVSYILQRIEQFDGIVILATNLYNNIDKAFLRRMKYVLKYQSPDAAMRRSIWEDCLPPELPREELDIDYLSKQFDFTGGIIKNVVYAACVMAIHDRRKLCMEHVLSAVRAEYEKLERPVTREMWGKYGELMAITD